MVNFLCLFVLCSVLEPESIGVSSNENPSHVSVQINSSGLIINGHQISREWSIAQLDKATGMKGRWIIPTQQERDAAMQKFGKPLTSNIYLYDDIGIKAYVDYQTGVVKSVSIYFGGREYSNSPKSTFPGEISVVGAMASRSSTINSLKATGMVQSRTPFVFDLGLGPFRYSFIFDDASNTSNLAEISLSLR